MGGGITLEDVYKRYIDEIYRFLLNLSRHPHTAEDLTQDTFVRAYLYLETYRGENVRAWLYKIARHVFVDWLRRGKREIAVEQISVEQLAAVDEDTPERIYLFEEEFMEGIELIRQLPEKQCRVIILHDYYGFSYQEIAKMLSISLSDVKVSLYRGRKRLASLTEELEVKKQKMPGCETKGAAIALHL